MIFAYCSDRCTAASEAYLSLAQQPRSPYSASAMATLIDMWKWHTVCMLVLLSNQAMQLLNAEDQINFRDMKVRLSDSHDADATGRAVTEGRVEISLDKGKTWGTLCSSNFGIPEAKVICAELNLGYADRAELSQHYGDADTYPWALVGTVCRGNERRLGQCYREREYPRSCNGANKNVAVVRCVRKVPDLELVLDELEESIRLDIVPLSRLKCALEENCLAQHAYLKQHTDPEATISLLRFPTRAKNVGDVNFRPYTNYTAWQWHQCHSHYHSMEAFAVYHMMNKQHELVAEGHKASFCLMDSVCDPGVSPKYTCGSQSQGISVGCADVYYAGLDCQWIDTTMLEVGKSYILSIEINPDCIIPEKSYENNCVHCVVDYTGDPSTTRAHHCRRAPPSHRIRGLA